MNDSLTCGYADSEQKIAAYRNVHEFWPNDRTLEEHLAWRLASPQHQQAIWCVGCLGDQVVVSLGCYRIGLHWQQQSVPAILVGAVHTLPEYRGRGYAPRLLAWAEEQQRADGVGISGLYSDIAPGFYGRLGYKQCEAWELQVELDQVTPRVSGWSLEPIDPHAELSSLRGWYAASQVDQDVWVERDDNYWQYLLARSTGDRYYQLISPNDGPQGFVRIQENGSEWVVHDWGLGVAPGESLASMVNAIMVEAVREGCRSLAGWLPRIAGLPSQVRFVARPQEITMFKCLDAQLEVTPEIVAASAFLREIDHV